ncbi:MAG: hypothetical protein KDD92_11430 [Caldilineaceae bacterium]|nr:hypothetical protein [Caldilineaceae bacterium]
MTQRRWKSYLLVLIQFVCLAGLALTGPILARHPLWLAVELLAIGLGVWALVSMGYPTLNITPDVKPEGRLIERGPYRWIRHPMYTSLIIGGGALVLDSFSWLRLGIWLLLLVDLLIKLRYEESLLRAHYPGYAALTARTWRLLPFIF